jgi:hypothetical protein
MRAIAHFGLLVALGASTMSCTFEPRYDETILNSYRVGMSRQDARSLPRDSSLPVSQERPSTGWSTTNDDYGIPKAVIGFERTHGGLTVQWCDAYSVLRGQASTIRFGGAGLWVDYLFFDVQEKLVGFERQFVD